MKLYSVSWGLGSVRTVRVRAEDAVDAASRIRERYGWRRAGSCTFDVKTWGDICCEMPIERSNGQRNLLVAVEV